MALPNSQQPLYACLNHQQNYGGLNTPGGTTSEILIDFANGSYTVDGVPVTVEEVTAEDLVNWNSYDPADIVPGSGYPSLGAGPILAGAAAQAVLDGCTMIVDWDILNDTMQFDIFEPTFTSDYKWLNQTFSTLELLRYTDATEFEDSPVAVGDGHHKIAVTQLFGSMAMSVDGNIVQTVASAAAEPPPTLVGFYLDGSSPSTFIRSITIMPPQDNAELVGLSTL